MSQEDKVLSFLKEGNSITSLDAFRFWGITRISAHIHSLKNQGFDIVREDIRVKNREGKKATVGRWYLRDTNVNDYVTQIEMAI